MNKKSIEYFCKEFDYLKDMSFDYCKIRNPYILDILCKDFSGFDFDCNEKFFELFHEELWKNYAKIPKIEEDKNILEKVECLPKEIKELIPVEVMGMKKHSPQDYFNLEKLNFIYESGLFEKIKEKDDFSIMEFGNTFGGLGYYIKKLFPNVSYWCLDYTKLLKLTSVYLSETLPEFNHVVSYPCSINNKNKAIHYLSNFLLEEFLTNNIKFDLVLSFLSLSEMLIEEMDYYIDSICKMCKDKGYFLCNNWTKEEFGSCDVESKISQKFNYSKEINIKNQTHGKCNMWWNFSDVVYVKIKN